MRTTEENRLAQAEYRDRMYAKGYTTVTVWVPLEKTQLVRDYAAELAGATKQETSDFEAFWQAYPRKDDKRRAMKAFKRLTKKDVQAAMEDVKTRAWPKDKKFCLLPTTYLNGRRWEDESAQAPSQTESVVAKLTAARGQALGKLMRSLGLGDGPVGYSEEQARAWAIGKVRQFG